MTFRFSPPPFFVLKRTRWDSIRLILKGRVWTIAQQWAIAHSNRSVSQLDCYLTCTISVSRGNINKQWQRPSCTIVQVVYKDTQSSRWNQAMYPGAGLFISQKKGYFSLINTEVGRWTNANLSHSLQKAWILLILKTSYLGFPGGFFIITSSTTVLHFMAVYIQYLGSLCLVAGSFSSVPPEKFRAA